MRGQPNSCSLAGWAQVLYFALKTLKETGHESVYDAVEKPPQLAQTAAVLKILHGLVGLVRSPVSATLPQIGSRLFLTWGSFPQVRSRFLVSSLVISWSITIIRYSFGLKEALGFAPSWHKCLRYSSFLVLYPASEVGLIYLPLPHIKTSEMYIVRMPNTLNFSFDFFYATILVLAFYVPGSPVHTCTGTCLVSVGELSLHPRGSKSLIERRRKLIKLIFLLFPLYLTLVKTAITVCLLS